MQKQSHKPNTFPKTNETGFQENPEYLTEQLITYIGNKRALLDFIGNGLEVVRKKLSKKKLKIVDIFSGSGVVARYLKRYSSKLIVNDIEKYSKVINECYLTNKSAIDFEELKEIHFSLLEKLNNKPLNKGVITKLYAPKDDKDIRLGERVFYTNRNAEYLDTVRLYIEDIPKHLRHFFLAPLLSEASIHANTSGVFKGFYKNSKTGIGQFGGNNRDALFRIKGNIELPFPIFSNFECDVKIYNEDSNKIAESIEEVDLVYLDPPYNQHPYGSNYFMLNLLVDYLKPESISKVSGIPNDWQRSNYNKIKLAEKALRELVEKIKAKYLLISFNSEGFISLNSMLSMLNKIGKVELLETQYNTFRASRNLSKRAIHVKEYLYLVKKT